MSSPPPQKQQPLEPPKHALTPCIPQLVAGIKVDPPPVLQVLSVKMVPRKPADPSQEKYRCALSDGTFVITCMLSSQLANMAISQELKRHSIIRLVRTVTNEVSKEKAKEAGVLPRRIIILLELDVLQLNVDQRVGNPQQFETSTMIDATSGEIQPPMQQLSVNSDPHAPPQQQRQQQPDHQREAQMQQQRYHQGEAQMQQQHGQQQHGQQQHGQQQHGQQQHGQQQQQHGQQQFQLSSSSSFQPRNVPPLGGGMSGFGPSADFQRGGNRGLMDAGDLPMAVFPITSLNPYQHRWLIKARVTAKSEMRQWKNQRGEGKLFNIDLCDKTGEIRATAFNDIATKFFDMVEVNKVYLISGAKLQSCRPQFSTVKNNFELTFDSLTEIRPTNDDSSIPKLKHSFIPIDAIERMEKDALVDVIGIVTDSNDITQTLVKSTNKQISKRDITLTDMSQTSVAVTLWAEKAEDFDFSNHPIVAFKGLRVSDFNGRTLSSFKSSVVTVNPDIPESYNLRGWYDSIGSQAAIRPITVGRSGGGSIDMTSYQTIGEFQDGMMNALATAGDRGAMFTTIARVQMLSADRSLFYFACPECKKKMQEEPSSYHCERCNKQFRDPNIQYNFSAGVCDHTAQIYLRCFDSGETLLGRSAPDLMALKEDNEAEFQAVLKQALWRPFLLRVRCRQENMNDEQRTSYSLAFATPLDYVRDARSLLERIRQLSK